METPDAFRENRSKSKPAQVHHEQPAPSPYADFYNMSHTNRGTALIFNHVNFSGSLYSKREGSGKDTTDLTNLLHELNFDVLVHHDLSAAKIRDVLSETAQMDHSNSDCLVVCVMSHGDKGILYAKDKSYRTGTLWNSFSAIKCPSLAGKPKLFFIQACRGDSAHGGAELSYNLETDGDSRYEAYYSIPSMADILVMYSTMEGYYSWRDPREGSYFIQSLVNQLNQHYKQRDLLTILTFVNREVAIDFTSTGGVFSGSKQMCSIVSMLTRILYFTQTQK